MFVQVGRELVLGGVRGEEVGRRGYSLNPDFATATSYDM